MRGAENDFMELSLVDLAQGMSAKFLSNYRALETNLLTAILTP